MPYADQLRGLYPTLELEVADLFAQDDIVDEAATALLHQVAGVAILHLRDDGWEFIKPVIDAEAWAAFRGLLAFATWTAAHATEGSFTVASKSGHESEAAA